MLRLFSFSPRCPAVLRAIASLSLLSLTHPVWAQTITLERIEALKGTIKGGASREFNYPNLIINSSEKLIKNVFEQSGCLPAVFKKVDEGLLSYRKDFIQGLLYQMAGDGEYGTPVAVMDACQKGLPKMGPRFDFNIFDSFIKQSAGLGKEPFKKRWCQRPFI